MSQITDTVARIRGWLRLGEGAAPETGRKLAMEYAVLCRELNRKLDACGQFLMSGQLIEAVRAASEMAPSLAEQAKECFFPELDEWIILCENSKWEVPERVRTDVLNRLKDAEIRLESLNPLLAEYRKLARSSDIAGKIYLLRKIIAVEPSNPDWKNNLETFEKIRLQELTSLAKQAIEKSDYQALSFLFAELANPAWRIKPSSLVLDKVRRVLEDRHLEELQVLADRLLGEINGAYSNFDVAALDDAMAQWNALVEIEGYNPDIAAEMQVKEAAEYLAGEKKKNADEQEYQSLIALLRKQLEEEAPADEMTKTFNRAEFLRSVPDDLASRYRAAKEAHEEIQQRRRRVRVLAVFLAVAGVAVLLGSVVCTVVQKRVEREWAAKVAAALEQEDAVAAEKILNDLKASAPRIYRRPAIVSLTVKVDALKAAQTEKRKQFAALVKELKQKLDAPDVNLAVSGELLASLSRFIVDGSEKNLFLEMKRKFDEVSMKQAEFQNRKYLKVIGELRKLRSRFFTALESQDFTGCGELLEEYAVLREQAGMIPNVSADVIAANSRYMNELSSLRRRLEAEQRNRDFKNEKFYEIMNARNLAALEHSIASASEKLHDDAEFRKIQALFSGVRYARVLAGLRFDPRSPDRTEVPGPYEAYPVFQDLKYLQKEHERNAELLRKLKNTFGRLHKNTGGQKLFMLGFRDSLTGQFHDFYYYGQPASCEIIRGVNLKLALNCLADESERAKFLVKLDCDWKAGTANLQVVKNGEEYRGVTMIYPVPSAIPAPKKENPTFKLRAPHLTVIGKLHEALGKISAYEAEETAMKSVAELCRNSTVNPYLKLLLCKMILEPVQLLPCAGSGDSYKGACDGVNTVLRKLPADFNWMALYRKSELSRQMELADAVPDAESLEGILARNTLARTLYETALSRRLAPVGILRRSGRDYTLVLFDNAAPSGELWSVESRDRTLVLGTYHNTDIRLLPTVVSFLKEAQIVYSPGDRRDTAELAKQFLAQGRECGLVLKWPQSWPENMRK